jgi:hypothetical protein
MRKLGTCLIAALCTTALLVACADTPTPTENTPQFSFANNPFNGNPRIARFSDRAGYLLIDPTTNLFSVQASGNLQFGCNAPPDFFTFMDVQGILHNPDDPLFGQINELRLARGVFIAVFQGWADWEAGGFDCDDLFSRKLAEGVGNFTATDNDVFVFLRENNNANAFGFVAQGKLERVGGGTAHYNGVSKCVWDGNDFASGKCKDKINFR